MRCIGLIGFFNVHRIRLLSVPSLHQIFYSRCFVFHFNEPQTRSFFTQFLYTICFYELELPFSNIKSTFQLSLVVASVPEDVKILAEFFCPLTVVLFDNDLFGDLNCQTLRGNFSEKRTRSPCWQYSNVFFLQIQQ